MREDDIVPGMEDDYGYATKKNAQPWWNDGDKVAGLVATIFILGMAALFIMGIIWIGLQVF